MHKKLLILATLCLDAVGNHATVNQLFYAANEFANAHNFESAAALYRTATEIMPSSWTIYSNMGYALGELARYADAAQAYEHALRLNESSPELHRAYATVLLALGDFKRGWQEYEWRWESADRKSFRLPCPAWDGQEPLQGKTIVLVQEGALGDCLQFVRYAKRIKESGARVIVHVHPALRPLLQQCPYLDGISITTEPIISADFWASLMSLPALLCHEIAHEYAPIPYLFSAPALVHHWNKKLPGTGMRVGVCWQADLSNDANRPPLAQRSFAPTLFEPLSKIADIHLISLLKKSSEIPAYIHTFDDVDTEHGAFMDTAAIMSNLHLVISVDTSVAHLAGALGIPTWLIVPFKADWRWGTTNTDSPWYPTMRLFRRTRSETWDQLIARITQEIILFKEQV